MCKIPHSKPFFLNNYYYFIIYSGKFHWEKASFLQVSPDQWSHLHSYSTHSELLVSRYNHTLIYCTVRAATGAIGVKGLVQGHLSGSKEGGASTAVSLSPPRFILPVPGLNLSNLYATDTRLLMLLLSEHLKLRKTKKSDSSIFTTDATIQI